MYYGDDFTHFDIELLLEHLDLLLSVLGGFFVLVVKLLCAVAVHSQQLLNSLHKTVLP